MADVLADHDWTRTRRSALLGIGLLLAVAAPFAAPSSAVLPAPDDLLEQLAAIAVLALAVVIGYARPLPAFYLLVVVTVLEGATRKWIVNDIVLFLVKDFLLLGIYAAVLPALTRDELRRPGRLLIPLGGILLLALVYATKSGSLSQAAIGVRAYALYVPLLWVAPTLLSTQRRVMGLLLLVLGLGVAEALLAAAQTVTGDAWLNQTVAGVRPALLVVGDAAYLRATGTMLQVGTLAAFLLFPLLVAFALVMRHSRGAGLTGGVVAIGVLSWGVTFTGSRALFATTLVAAGFLFVYLIWRRRFFSLAAVPMSVLLAFLVITYQPFLGTGDGGSYRTETFTYIDADGVVKTETSRIGQGGAKVAGGFIGRAGGNEGPGTTIRDNPKNRIVDQLEFIADQGLGGHGTGAMSLGSQYLLPERDEAAESQYAKLAYELGLPGLALFLWFLLALFTRSAWSAFVAQHWQAPAATVALGAMTLVPLLTLLTYAFDYPIVALLYYTLAGCAAAWAAAAS